MKVLYTPFSIVAGIIGSRAGKKAFTAVWGRVSDSPKPTPTQPDVTIAQVAFASALEAATVAAVGATVNTISARAFHYLFGFWPGKRPKAPAEGA